ncbi:hypothetical protein EDB86DRAFT_2833594 [Lactarius hatsudake]|nr:hypothetical protein EDB86DRAFT_2833594 [Lactarius hatsudake]
MPRNIIHSDVSMDPESESEALSIAPDPEEEPEVELEEEEEGEGGGEEEDEEGDEGEEGEEGDEAEEEEEADDAEEEGEDEEAADDGDGDAVQESDLDELSSPSASPPPAQTAPSRTSRLKITLKLPSQKPARVRRAAHKDKDPDSAVESEDDDDQPRGGAKRPLTTRQAVLASVVGSSHVSLDETSRKKKQLNEAEIALRREETARKRKHLSEKKLEDEKSETINRLLKKKSGTRNRRNALATAEDRTPATQTGNGTPAEGEPEEEESEVAAVPIVEVVPTCYRWISTSRPAPDAPSGEEKMTLSFSVPASLLPTSHQVAVEGDGDGDVKVGAQEEPRKPPAPAVCNVDGCTATRKYRLVRDLERGACGMGHLHLLETQSRAVAT